MKSELFREEKGAPVSDLKTLTDEGEFEGYASVFGEVDHDNDIVIAGAFQESLRRRGPGQIKLLWQHMTSEVIGKWLEIREDRRGLYVKGKLLLGIQRARECYELMREEALDGLSIGFRTIDEKLDPDTGARRLVELDLREISLVTFPALETATVSRVKRGHLPTEREFERWLTREAGFMRSEAKVIIAKGFKSLQVERDAEVGDIGGLREAVSELSRTLRG
ncbi:MAG: HK97 family phage prohead protease [Hyphomicrobiales bacterium]|nr:HK97 family phage prohead protease [Hyphomicrobiales bacterium]